MPFVERGADREELDTQARYRLIEGLRASEERYHLLFDANPIPTWVYDVETLRFLEVNEAAVRQYGYSKTEFSAMTLKDIRPAEDVPILLDVVRDSRDEVDVSGQWRHRRKNGEVFYVEITGHAFSFDGRYARLVLAKDITNRIIAEAALSRTLAHLQKADEQRRALLARVVMEEEEQRRRLAEDFHDDTIQVMASAILNMEVVRQRSGDEEQAAMIEAVRNDIRDAAERLRRLMFDLRPAALDREGLVPALRAYVSVGRDSVPSYRIVDRLRHEPGPDARTVLFRCAQEALVNVRKHAGADNVEVTVEEVDGGVAVRVTDDGRGFKQELVGNAVPGHLGLVSMRERVEMAGGRLRIHSEEGVGTSVDLWVPNDSENEVGP